MKVATLFASVLLCFGSQTWAGSIPTVPVNGKVHTVNYSGFVVEADAITGRVPDRSKITGEWTMDFAWDTLDTIGATYESTMWFEDDAGQKVSIIPDGGGPAVTEIVEEYQVSLNSGTPNDSHTFSIAFKPEDLLSPQKRYKMKAKWRSKIAGGTYGTLYVLVPLHSTEPNTQQYFHFDNTTSGDLDVNAQSWANITSWDRRWMIAGATTQGTMQFNANVIVWRFDGFNAAASATNITTTLSVALKNDVGTTVWTAPDHDVVLSVPSHDGGTGAAADPAFATTTTTVNLNVPANVLTPGQLYTPVITVSHSGETSRAGTDGSRAFDAQHLLRFSNRIFFGTVQTTFDQVTNDPVADLYPNASPLPTSTLSVPAQHGFIPGVPSAWFGGSSPLAVEIEADGDAVYGDGTQIPVSAPTTVNVHGSTVTRTGVTLSMNGLKAATMSVRLPRGMGWSPTAGTRVMKTKITNTDVPLDANLELPGLAVVGGAFISLERLPLVFGAPAIGFSFATGSFTFTPNSVAYDSAFELTTLEAFHLAVPSLLDWPLDKLLHSGNDQVFRLAKDSGNIFEVSTGSDGAAFINSARVAFHAGAFYTHFPRGLPIVCTAPGVDAALFEIENDTVKNTSKLTGLGTSLLPFSPDGKSKASEECPVGAPSLGVQYLTGQFENSEIGFLPDGSLSGDFNLLPLSGAQISWGTVSTSPAKFVHRVGLGFGSLLVPSHFLPWRTAGQSVADPAQANLAEEHRTAALHLAGRAGTAPTGWEYPHLPSYQEGKADYAGLNLRVSGQGTISGVSTISGQETPGYTLHPVSKFYLRQSGVTGRLQANELINLSVGASSPADVETYMMNLQLNKLRLSYRSNEVIESLTRGSVGVGYGGGAYASRFSLNFDGLKLDGNGALSVGQVPSDQPELTLQYWNTVVQPLTLSFVQSSPCMGPGDPTFLVVGVESRLPSLAQSQLLRGTLAFRGGNGSLVARSDADNDFEVTGLDSRFYMPGNVQLQSQGGSAFTMIPVTGAYLNRWTANPVPTTGFVNLLGAIDVPFFENLQAHLHTSASSTSDVTPSIKVMSPGAGLGPFDKALFDPQNLGVPQDVTLTNYTTPGNYPLHAKKNWLGLLDLNYEVKWNSSQRAFETSTPLTADLLVINASSQVRALTPSQADITFKAQIGASTSISTTQLMGQALDGLGANPASLISQMTGAIPGGPSLDVMFQKIASFEECLADTPEKLIRAPLKTAISAQLVAHPPSTDASGFINAVAGSLDTSFDGGTGWKNEVVTRLDQADDVVDTLDGLASSAENIRLLAAAAASVLSGPAPPPAVPQEVTDALAKIRNALARIKSDISTVQTRVNALSLGLNSAQWTSLLSSATADLTALPLAGLSEAQKADAVADVLLNRLLGSVEISSISEQMREQVSGLRDDLRSSLDSVLGSMNDMTSSATGDLAGIPGMGEMQLGKVQGYARINGDSLHELRLDVDTDLSALGSPMAFKGYVLFRDLQSDTPGNACRTEAGVASEITLGAATSFSFGAPPAPTKLEVEAKFAFDNSSNLNGLSGRFGLAGDGFKLGPLTINQAELGFGFGAGDAYLYGLGKGKSDYADLEASVFLGTACNPMEVLGRIDPLVTELAQSPSVSSHVNLFTPPSPVFGIYAFGYGAVSVNSLIGIPPSCMLNLKAGLGFGGFVFTYKDAGQYDGVIGLRNDFGISGEVLCIADISARISLVGAASFADRSSLTDVFTSPPQSITGIGKADFEAEIGVDPFSVSVSKTLKVNFSYTPPSTTSYGIDF